MRYKTVKKIITSKGLEVQGETAGEFLLDLQRKLPVTPLDIVLSNRMKLSLGRERIEIKLPNNKEINSDVIEKIITEGTRLLLEENVRREFIYDRRRIKITMSLGDNTVYFTQGHLGISSDGSIMHMNPILRRTDNTFLRVLDSNFTSDMDSLEYFVRNQHNRTLGRSEEDRTQDIADKLGFTTVEKDDSIIDVEINGVTDSCMVTRLCVHTNEFQNEKELLGSIIDTYRDIMKIGENPLLIIGLDNLIDITIGRDRKTITIEPVHNQYSETIRELIQIVIDSIIPKNALENVKIEYKEDILVEGESLGNKFLERLNDLTGAIDKIRENHGNEISLGAALGSIPIIFLLFLRGTINPTNSYFHAAMVTISSILFAIIVTKEYRKHTWLKTFGQKKFLISIWFWAIASYVAIDGFGYNIYQLYITVFAIGIVVIIGLSLAYPHVARLFSPITIRLENIMGNRKTKVKKPSSEIIKKIGILFSNISNSRIWAMISILLKIVETILGAIALIIFVIAFLPMIGLFVIVNFLNRGYWRELEKYREDLIEKAVHKYRNQRNLAPSCRVIFKTTKCKKLKNPLSGSLSVLRKKLPRLLTADGFIDAVDRLILREWM